MKAWNELMSSLKSKMNIDTMDLICTRLHRCILSNLCTDFSEMGKLILPTLNDQNNENDDQNYDDKSSCRDLELSFSCLLNAIGQPDKINIFFTCIGAI